MNMNWVHQELVMPTDITPRTAAVEDFLEGCFRERREWPSPELSGLAKRAGFSRVELWEARKRLPIKVKQRTFDGTSWYWAWIADGGWPSEASP